MTAAEDFHDLGHGLFEWSTFDPAVKVDLHGHALVQDGVLICVDPVPLRKLAEQELFASAGVSSVGMILLTNGNHARAAGEFRRRFGAVIHAPEAAQAALRVDGLEVDGVPGELESLEMPGFGPGEVVYISPTGGGVVFVGDALINLPAPYGFSILPEKYCSDPRLARESLRRLLDVKFERMLFAHGAPLVAGARAKLEGLLAAAKR